MTWSKRWKSTLEVSGNMIGVSSLMPSVDPSPDGKERVARVWNGSVLKEEMKRTGILRSSSSTCVYQGIIQKRCSNVRLTWKVIESR